MEISKNIKTAKVIVAPNTRRSKINITTANAPPVSFAGTPAVAGLGSADFRGGGPFDAGPGAALGDPLDGPTDFFGEKGD